ncbi:MAG TPA: hypothetical protein VMC10_19450 [Stellaceae bacterium]|nr:hypothetical protein [Stellaceae bacterium]
MSQFARRHPTCDTHTGRGILQTSFGRAIKTLRSVVGCGAGGEPSAAIAGLGGGKISMTARKKAAPIWLPRRSWNST